MSRLTQVWFYGFLFLITFCACRALPAADEPVFSGPQVGEKLPEFSVQGVLDNDEGKQLDFVSRASGKPIVLIFVHEATRPSISFTRVLSAYTQTRAQDGLVTGIVWLDSDATAAENAIKRMKHALTPGVPVGVSADGREGPGSYGLNRNVMLTILIGKENKVTANFALVQPSLQADLPKVLQSIVDVVGGTVPKLSDLPGIGETMREGAASGGDPQLRSLLRAVIQRNATDDDVKKAAQEVEEYIKKHEAAGIKIGRIANTLIDSGKVTDYGTKQAQEVIRKWAKTYGSRKEKK